MPFPIVNSIVSWFLKKRFHQIELFLKYPIEVQEELLQNLIQKGVLMNDVLLPVSALEEAYISQHLCQKGVLMSDVLIPVPALEAVD